MDWLEHWKLFGPIAMLLADRGYALWRRSRLHLPSAPLSRVGRLSGRIASYESLLAVERLGREMEQMKMEARDARIAAQDAMIAGLKTQLKLAGSDHGLLRLPVGTPPSSGERRMNPHERRRTRSANAIIGEHKRS